MKIHRLTTSPDPQLSSALSRFEKLFTYPLGVDDSFSISHGEDYTCFFRSLGEASVYIAEVDGEIAGVMTVVLRTVVIGRNQEIKAAYLCDTKVAPSMRGSHVLARLAFRVKADLETLGIGAAYSVVMLGSTTPASYTGRVGIPTFDCLSRLQIVRWSTMQQVQASDFFRLKIDEPLVVVHGGSPSLKSLLMPQMIEVDGSRAFLLDTRKGKCLWRSDGQEMVSAHVEIISVANVQTLALLINRAREVALGMGYPGLFCTMPPGYAYRGNQALLATAAVYGSSLPAGTWSISTAEI